MPEALCHEPNVSAWKVAESAIPAMHAIIETAVRGGGVREVAIGMPHRGRLNTLVNIVKKPLGPRCSPNSAAKVLKKPDDVQGSGDVKYAWHLERPGHRRRHGACVAEANPSHLEAVHPVVLGTVRARQDQCGDAQSRRVPGILMHGDAAFAGQGVVKESQLSQPAGLPHRRRDPHRHQQPDRLHDLRP